MADYNKYRVLNTSDNSHEYVWATIAPSDAPSGAPIDYDQTLIVKGLDNSGPGAVGGDHSTGLDVYSVSLPKQKYNAKSYETIGSFIVPKFIVNDIVQIDVLGYMTSGDSYDVRLIKNQSNNLPVVMCETNLTNTDDSIQTLDTCTNQPTADSVIDIGLKYTGSRVEGYVYGLALYYEL